MMKFAFLFAAGVFIFGSSCSVYRPDLPVAPCPERPEANPPFSKAKELEDALGRLVRKGIPGVAMGVLSGEGYWEYATGYAQLEGKVPMGACHLHYLQSISKTYMAAAILKLYEDGKLELEESIVKYLPEIENFIPRAGEISLRMLLNHTSGAPEYNSAPAYVTILLQKPEYPFTPWDYLSYIKGKPLQFEPGSKYAYCNTNYELLALVADRITGDHARYISEVIFKPLGLTQSFYRNEAGYLDYPHLLNAYWDRHSDGVVENVSQMQRYNVRALVGDDGIVATPRDAVRFLKGLLEGEIISRSTLGIMQEWVKDGKGDWQYGLGLDYARFGGEIAYGHSGGGLGAGCQLYYFPSNGLYFFVGINLGTVTDSPIHKEAEGVLEELYRVLLR